jgi:8-amino-7-oxononanoate synthase
MGLFDRFKTIREVHGAVKACGADPFGVKMDRIVSPMEVDEGRPIILRPANYL